MYFIQYAVGLAEAAVYGQIGSFMKFQKSEKKIVIFVTINNFK